MKKLLSVLGAISLTGSAILVSTQVVSCNATWSQEFRSILNKDAQTLTGKSYFNEGLKNIGTDSEGNEVKIKSIELIPNQEILDNPKDLEKIANESLKLFADAKEYFDQFFDGSDTSEYYYYLLEDKGNNGDYSKVMNYESEKNFLDHFGDAIIKPEFQLNAARFMVLKNNYEFNKEYQNKLNTNDAEYEEIQKMNTYIKAGYFVPMFKIIGLGKVISRGTSMTKVKFDKNLVEYINVGGKGQDYLNSYVGTLWDTGNPKTSSIITYNWNPDTSTRLLKNKDWEFDDKSNNEKQEYLNGWRFAEDYKGKSISEMTPEEQLRVDNDLEMVFNLGAKNINEDFKKYIISQKINESDYNIIPREHAMTFETVLNQFEVMKFFNYGFDQDQSGGTS
ncbi:hypothetical protein [Spiroplasma diminutum]|uniref:Lipoprotein n=1 Tax=Spiroplasma diminutum CUAS-1 TaxID=1276221 RepID=S5MDV4_9MOLU|nr:hypothetical protein [Spiroplasma diminutum]AGR41898.1 hypothetical protein SDIMI_v3c01940 [Spiroplasma diminutum CUAS-1]